LLCSYIEKLYRFDEKKRKKWSNYWKSFFKMEEPVESKFYDLDL